MSYKFIAVTIGILYVLPALIVTHCHDFIEITVFLQILYHILH